MCERGTFLARRSDNSTRIQIRLLNSGDGFKNTVDDGQRSMVVEGKEGDAGQGGRAMIIGHWVIDMSPPCAAIMNEDLRCR